MIAPMAHRARRGRGADRWSGRWLFGAFAFWTVLAVMDRDWNRALSPAIFLVGFAAQAVLKKMHRPNAAAALDVGIIACVFVVSIVQQTWLLAVVMGLGLLVMAAIWGLALWPDKPERAVDGDS